MLEGTRHHVITGNTFTGMNGSAIRADAKTGGLVVTGNLVTDFGKRTEGEVKALPAREDIQMPIQEQLIVELYYR